MEQRRSRRRLGSTGYAEFDPDMQHAWIRLGDRLLPPWVDVTMPGAGDQPQLTLRLEVVAKVPMCREVRITSKDGDREVRQLDLGAVHIAELVNEIYGVLSVEIISEQNGVLTVAEHGGDPAQGEAVRHVAEARKGRGARKITPEFLAEVAGIYRSNVDGNPAQAIERALAVSPRMAGNYIRRARDLGLLPETTGGKKKA